MGNAKPVSSPLAFHFKFSSKQCPTSEKEKEEMKKIPYSSTVGSLMYVMHWNAVKWILRYLRGTSKVCLHFGTGKPELVNYTDADMVGDINSRKSTSGYLMAFAGGAISWQSRL
ncbi:hypothetical protein CRG98_039116 [Punica granatum]|uniref:Retrovirus-related Pol polyprotein from transposon TNT 1-94 n=1 Tax=Punica granatum TaxID=22663 RepID=A0A2I0I9W4_PUNGR|nr:hypothetical protein CRG98_039116 [Punica granatum]